MALSNDIRINIDALFPGEGKFKSAESSAQSLARELEKLEQAQRAQVQTELAAYAEGERRAAAHEAAVRRAAATEIQAHEEDQRRTQAQEDAVRRMAQLEEQAYSEDARRAAGEETSIRRMASLESQAYAEEEARAQEAADAVTEANDAQAEAMEKVGVATTAMGAAIVTGLSIATAAAMDWEGAWAGVTKTVDGTPEQMLAVEDSLRDLSKVLPASHEEIAGVAEAAGQLGVKAPGIVAFTRTMIDLGETTNLASDEAATGLAQLMNVMGTAPEDVGRLGSALVALGNDGASTEADILNMASYITGAVKLVGGSESDLLAISNAMTSMGINAERGGGVMSRVLTDIYSAVQSGGDQLDAYAEVAGLSATEFAAAWEADPIRAVDSFVQGLNRVEGTGGNVVEVLGNLGIKGTQDVGVLLQMKGAGDLLTDSLELGNKAWEENLALTLEASKRYETTEARLGMARNQINDVAIDIGANFLPMMASGLETVADLTASFDSLPDGAQSFIAYLGLAAGAIVTATGVASVAIPKMRELAVTMAALNGGASAVGRGLGTALSVLTGPWGIALAAAATLTAVFAAKQGAAAREVTTLADALEASTGNITTAARQVKVDQLIDDGVFEQAERLGISLATVTDAALGNKAAMAEVDAQLSAVFDSATATSSALGNGGDALDHNAQAAADLQNALHGSSGATTEAQELARQKAAAMGEDAAATDAAAAANEAAAPSVDEMAEALAGGTEQADELAGALDALSKALDVLNGPQLSANEAARAWEESIRSAQAALEENGQTLDITTEKGSANAEVLDTMAQAAQDSAKAILENTGNQDAFRASLDGARGTLFETAKQFGMTDEAAQAYVDSVLAVPDKAATAALFDDTAARAKIQAFIALLNSVPESRRTSVGVTAAPTMLQRSFYQADGGVVEYYADGGQREQHVAQIAPAGAMRIWAEEETGGEAYIPLGASKRTRSKAIAADVVSQFGGVVQWYVDGGTRGTRGATVTQAAVARTISAVPGRVSDERYAAALDGEAAAAGRAADAEATLARIRAGNTAALKLLKEQLEEVAYADKERRDAGVEAEQKLLDQLKDRQREELQALKDGQKTRTQGEADRAKAAAQALKDKNKGGALDKQIRAADAKAEAASRLTDKAQEAELRATQKRQDDEVEAAQQRITDLKKANEAATRSLKQANDDLLDQRQAEATAAAAAAEEDLTAAKEAAKVATDELAASEKELAEAQDRAAKMAESVRDALTKDASLTSLLGDTSPADLDAAATALAKAAEAAGRAGGTVRGEKAGAALERRQSALADLAAQAEAYADAQDAFGVAPEQVRAGLDAQIERITQLGAAYGLTAQQVGELTGQLGERGTSATDLLASARREAEQVTEMARLLRQLSDAGLDDGFLDELSAQGTQGLSTARSLVGADPNVIAELNATRAQIESVATDVGAFMAANRYDPNRISKVAITDPVLIDTDTMADFARRFSDAVAANPPVVTLDGAVVSQVLAARAADEAYRTAS